MSTYINGVTTYIPQIQPSDVNLAVESQYANFRLQKHDAAKKQLSDLYGSLLNSPLSRQDNIDARDKFFEAIEGQVKKISGMDLSLDQNVQQAASIFNQLLDDKYILKDMSWTRNYENELLNSQYLKNACTDPDKCNGEWWDGGDRLLEYDREAFANASADESLRFGNTRYIPKQNVTKRALDLAKKYNVQIQAEQTNGMYIVTQKNGELAEPTFQMMFNGMIADDPYVREYYGAKARVERLDYMHQHAEEYGSMENAERAYINEMMREMQYVSDGNGNIIAKASQEEILRANADKAKDYADYSKTVGEALKIRSQQTGNQSLSNTGDKLLENSYYFDREYDRANSVITKINRDNNYGDVSGEQVDALIAWHSLKNDVLRAARMASLLNAEMNIREDKYGLEQYKASLKAEQDKKDTETGLSEAFKTTLVEPEKKGVGTVTNPDQGAASEASEEAGESILDLHKAVAKLATNPIIREAYKSGGDIGEAVKQCADKLNKAVKSSIVKTNGTFLSVASIDADRESYEMIRDNADYLKALLSTGDVKDSPDASDLRNKITDVVQSYEKILNTKEKAQLFAKAVSAQVDAYGLKYGKEDDTSYKKLKGLADKVASGEPVSTMDLVNAMYSGGSSEILEHMKDSKFFYNTDSDVVNMDGYEMLGILSTLDENDNGLEQYLAHGLKDCGIYKAYDTDLPQSFKDEHPFLYAALTPYAYMPIPKGVGSKFQNSYIDVAKGFYGLMGLMRKPSDMILSALGYDDIVEKANNADNTINSAAEKLKLKPKLVDADGNPVIDSDGNISDKIDKDKLSQKVDLYVPNRLRQTARNYAESLLGGNDKFKSLDESHYNNFGVSSLFVPAISGIRNAIAMWGGEKAIDVDFNEIMNKMNQAFAFTEISNDGGYGNCTYGNDASKSCRFDVTNNEKSFNTKKMLQTLEWFVQDTNPQDLIIATGYYDNIQEAHRAEDDLWDYLGEKGITKQELIGEMQRIIEKGFEPKYDKKGNVRQYDEDLSYMFYYNPIGLGSSSYSTLTVDKRLLAATLRSLNLTEKEISEIAPNLVIYNKHGRGKEGNGYSPIDNIYKLSPYDKLIKLSGSDGYRLPDRDYARDISVSIDRNTGNYNMRFHPLLGYDKNGVPVFATGDQWEYFDDWATDDGFSLGWELFDNKMTEYLEKTKINL